MPIAPKCSSDGAKAILAWEAMVLVAYRDGGTDAAPRYSISAGVQIPVVHPGDRITLEEGFRRYREFLDVQLAWAVRLIQIEMPQHAWDAFYSFAHNMGSAEIKDVARAFNAKGYRRGALQMAAYDKGLDGIAARRGEEIFRCTHDWYGDLTYYKLWRENPRTTHYELVPFPETV